MPFDREMDLVPNGIMLFSKGFAQRHLHAIKMKHLTHLIFASSLGQCNGHMHADPRFKIRMQFLSRASVAFWLSVTIFIVPIDLIWNIAKKAKIILEKMKIASGWSTPNFLRSQILNFMQRCCLLFSHHQNLQITSGGTVCAACRKIWSSFLGFF